MGYFSCNRESSIILCDPYNLDTNKKVNKKKKKSPSYKIRRFSYTDLDAATNGFSKKYFLGKGSHGSVYKAVLNNGKFIVAVKKSTLTTSCHENNRNYNKSCIVAPGENEIEILSRIRNPHFVNLLGYSFESSEKSKLIVVEYMSNGSLYDFLHLNPLPPSWAKRVRFALQIAKAVEALHSSNPPVIHRDIKSSNVLIDGNWNARLGDFGLALRGYAEDVRIQCTPPAGTLGYLDPGYVAPENLSAKSDVFSFGILLLEIVSGRNAIDVNYSPPSVVDWALPIIKHGEFVALCDPRIDPPDDLSVIQELAMLAVKCVKTMAEKRPSMADVVECLRVVNKRVYSSIWNNLRRQTRKQSPLVQEEMSDAGKEVLKTTSNHTSRISSLTKNRKVSSIQLSLSVDVRNELSKKVGICVGRSNSIGSISEINVESDTDSVGLVRRKSSVAVKMPVVKFSKSRSLGVLQSKRLRHCNERGFVLQLVKSPLLKGLDMSRLVISVDQAL
ncbi:hypothetical protein IFM89_035705 [Coptis chinensis]|uniref:Protein kinase domain-containing protein n=1 Tax=Coptis chinensis TaxID=261450 RepID=A0A835M8A2_9MAGN|nr:hypothetical protein IFM89_035705 [Coptis chinensis]